MPCDPCGRDTKRKTGGQSDCSGEGQNKRIDPWTLKVVQCRRPEYKQQLKEAIGKGNTESAAGHRNESGFNQLLPNQTAPRGSQRGPHGKLAAALGGTHQCEARDIDAGYQ